MYAPVSRQVDASGTAFGQTCAEAGFSRGVPANACLGAATTQKAGLVKTVQTVPGHAAETALSGAMAGRLEHAVSSLPMILIAAVLLLIPAVAMGFFGSPRWPGLHRG